MTTLREAAQMALDALEHGLPIIEDFGGKENIELQHKAIAVLYEALRVALAQPEQEPVAYLCENAVGHKYFRWKKPPSTYKPIALYTAHASPQRIWQGLTDEEYESMAEKYVTNCYFDTLKYARAIEAKLREKNNA